MHAYRSFAVRCRANTAHIRQSKPDSGPGCQANVLKTFYGVPPEILQVMSLRALKEVVKVILKVILLHKVQSLQISPITSNFSQNRGLAAHPNIQTHSKFKHFCIQTHSNLCLNANTFECKHIQHANMSCCTFKRSTAHSPQQCVSCCASKHAVA